MAIVLPLPRLPSSLTRNQLMKSLDERINSKEIDGANAERTNFCTGLFAGAIGYCFAGNSGVGSMMPEIECEFSCPHCGQGFTMDQEAIYIDDVEDECESTCSSCGGSYQLRCVSVDVVMEAIPIKKV